MTYVTPPTDPATNLIPLTEEQKTLIRDNVTKMKIGPLTTLVFPGAVPDGRTIEGKSIRAFVAEIGETVTNASSPAKPLELTEAQKQLADDLIRSDRVRSSLELARLVFPDIVVKKLSKEWRAVYTYANGIQPNLFGVTEEPVQEMEYVPPDRMQSLIALANTYITTGDGRKAYNPNNLKPSDARNLQALLGYLREYGFRYQASTYQIQVDRDLFVSTFVRWAHNKPDLTEIEMDQMVQAAAEKVNIAQIGREIEAIKQYHQSVMEGNEVDKDGKAKRFGMTDVEQITQTRTKHDGAKGRLEKLMDTLEGARSKRLAARDTRNNSLLNLFDAWRGDPEWRAGLISLGHREKAEDAAEVKRIIEMEDVIALISGLSEEEGAA